MLTLVLDMGYQPVNTVPFPKALRYVVKGKVDVLENYDLPIHPDWQMPAVVRLTGWMRGRKTTVRFSRQNVFARDRWRCQYCGQRAPTDLLTFDHVVPRSRGGKTCWENIVIACVPCNRKKGNRRPEEVGLRLRKKPERPTWLPMFNMGLKEMFEVPPEWRDYWIVELGT